MNRRARLLPNDIAWLLLPWAWRIMNTKMPIRNSVGKRKPAMLKMLPHRDAFLMSICTLAGSTPESLSSVKMLVSWGSRETPSRRLRSEY